MSKDKKGTLWIRKLSCGHERPTNISFIMGNYKKPKVGGTCTCRECWEEVKIIKVIKAKEIDKEELKGVQNEVNKFRKGM